MTELSPTASGAVLRHELRAKHGLDPRVPRSVPHPLRAAAAAKNGVGWRRKTGVGRRAQKWRRLAGAKMALGYHQRVDVVAGRGATDRLEDAAARDAGPAVLAERVLAYSCSWDYP